MEQPTESGTSRQIEKPAPPRRGFLNPQMVRSVSFAVIAMCLLFCTVISILAIWDFIVRDDLVWRAFSTMLIVGLATWVFNQINERFGE